ncbi:hypothetical protein Hanom_Chr07g00605051 [Helianthus anomalus]
MWWRVRLINNNGVSVFNTTDRHVIFTSPKLVAVVVLCSGGKLKNMVEVLSVEDQNSKDGERLVAVF